jgi:hypothetical protein
MAGTFWQLLPLGHAVQTETIPVLNARIAADHRVVIAPITANERKEFAAAVVWMSDAAAPKDIATFSAFSGEQRLLLCKMLGMAHSPDIATTAARILRTLIPPLVVPGQPRTWVEVMAPHMNAPTTRYRGPLGAPSSCPSTGASSTRHDLLSP